MSDESVGNGASSAHGIGELTGLVLDFGGVLTTSFESALRSYCVRDGLAPDALDRVFSLDTGAKGALVDLECGKISQADFVAQIAPALGVEPDGLLQRMVADLHLEPVVASAAASLRRQGIRVGVLSNSWGSRPFDPYRPFKLDERFDAVVISDQVRLRKPDPAIFLLMAQRLGVAVSECVFVDDVERYLEPARALGMMAIHATDPARTADELERLFGLSCR